MDILLLKTFLAVCEQGSFSGAADKLNSVQSNITTRIKRLEEHFNQPVFERGRGGARLTSFGERVRTHAEDLLARFESAERELLDVAGARAPLRLGSMETTAAVRLPLVLKMFKKTFSKTPLSLHTGPSAELLSLTWDRKIDAAFVAGPVDKVRFGSIAAFYETLVMAKPKGQEADNSLLAFRAGCSYRAIAETWLRDHGKSDTDVMEMGTLDGILGCVEAGMGFAIAPEEAIRRYHRAEYLEIETLPNPIDKTVTYLAWRVDQPVTQGLQGLIDLLAE